MSNQMMHRIIDKELYDSLLAICELYKRDVEFLAKHGVIDHKEIERVIEVKNKLSSSEFLDDFLYKRFRTTSM